MAIDKGPIEGGQGGKLGHSNMSHWDYTEAIKAASRKLRRQQAKRDIADGLAEHQTSDEVEISNGVLSNELSKQPNPGP